MDERRAAYFGRVVDRLEQDPRTDLYPNLPILVLKETLDLLPPYIEPDALINHLFHFIEKEKDTLSRVIYDARYVADNTILAPHCIPFIESVIRDTLVNVDPSDQDDESRSQYRLEWPIKPDDFPYSDDEDIEGDDGL